MKHFYQRQPSTEQQEIPSLIYKPNFSSELLETKMAMNILTPQESCDIVLTTIRDSDLHFMVQETPHSLYVTVRKRFGTRKSSRTKKSQPRTTCDENSYYSDLVSALEKSEAQLEAKKVELGKAVNNVKLLENKLEGAEAEVTKLSNHFNSKKKASDDEVKLLKKSIKTSSDNEANTNRALHNRT